ncbi:MAG: glucose-6-phosphate dehydrogenase, partial [Sphingobium yanoikuyae]
MTEPSATFLLFGATGDLARRMIFPSLYNLLSDGLLPDDFLIIASARTEMDDEAFREEVCAALKQFLPADRYDADIAARFRAMIL